MQQLIIARQLQWSPGGRQRVSKQSWYLATAVILSQTVQGLQIIATKLTTRTNCRHIAISLRHSALIAMQQGI